MSAEMMPKGASLVAIRVRNREPAGDDCPRYSRNFMEIRGEPTRLRMASYCKMFDDEGRPSSGQKLGAVGAFRYDAENGISLAAIRV